MLKTAQIAAQKCDFSCDKVAVLYCKGCDQFLCIECRQNVHDRVRQFKDHEVVNIHKEGNRVRPNPVCETHENQFLYYCTKCECLTCAECMTSSHNEHKTEKIKIVADARRKNVDQIIEKLKTKVETVKQKLETIDTEHFIQIKSDCESYVEAVEETVDDLHTIVDRHKLIPFTTASDFKNIENEDLGRKRAFFRNRHAETVDRLLKFENLMQEAHDSTFLTEWKALQTDVQMIDEETDDPLVAPRQIESFNQSNLIRSVIDDIDEKYQMKLQENEKKIKHLEEEKTKLQDEMKLKQEEIGKLSIKVDTNKDVINKLTINFEDEIKELKRKLKQTDKENTSKLQTGKLSTVQKASVNLKESSFIERKWSCHSDKPVDVIEKLSSAIIPQLEKQFFCTVCTEVNPKCISHQQLAQWVIPIKQAKDQRIVFVHGSVTDMAADVIVCPVTESGGPQTFGKVGKAIFKLGGSIMQREFEEMSRQEEIVISSATGNLPCLMVVYFPVHYFKPGVKLQKEMVKKIQDVLIEVEKTKLQSIVINTDIGNDIPESTFLHWFLDAYKAYQHKLKCLNQIYLCTESDNILPLLVVLKDGLSNYYTMFDFTAMFEQRSGKISVARKQADISTTLVLGKLVDQKVDVIVNSSNRTLDLYKGAVSASILAAGGEGIYEECKQSYPNGINYGEAITTNPGKLRCKVICHGCLPHWTPVADISCQILAKLVFDCLMNAEKFKSKSIAFPVFGTGNLMYPWDAVAKTMISTVYKYGRMFPETTMKEVRIVLYDKDFNSIEAFEQEKRKMEEVEMIPEDPFLPPAFILECRCENVKIYIEPVSSVEFHHCQAIVMPCSYQDALDLQKGEPHLKLMRDKITFERSKNKYWVITVLVDEQFQTFDEAILRALQFSTEKRLSTLAIQLMNVPGGLTLAKQASIIRNNVEKPNNDFVHYLQILKLMIQNKDDFEKIMAETIHKQEKERRTMEHKISNWLNVNKNPWKSVKYSEILQSPRLYITIVGDDENNMTNVLQKLTEEISVIKVKTS